MTVPLCSVIIPTFNRSSLLRHTLDSLTRQSIPFGSFEVLVVDDGSTDDTADVAASLSGQLQLDYLAQEDRGYRVAAARNLGLRQAAAPITVFLDSGVLLHSKALEAHIESHLSAGAPAAVCGYVYCFNENNEDGAEMERLINFADPDSTIASLAAQNRWLDFREEFYDRYADDFAGIPAPWLVWWTCNVSASTEQLRAVGGFDENYRSWGGEDVDLGYRLHRAGARFVLNRDAAAIHAPHPKNFADNLRSAANNYRYLAEKFDTPITRLVTEEIHFFSVNDVIRDRELPSCTGYLAARDAREPSALIIAPHPADDVIACGGIAARKTLLGAKVDVAFIGDGSQPHTVIPAIREAPASAELSASVRRRAEAAAAVLGLDASQLHFLGFADNRLAESLPQLRAAVRKLLTANRGVGEIYLPHDARELNEDHRLVGRIVLESIESLGMTPRLYKYVIWGEYAGPGPEPDGSSVAADTGERLLARDIVPQLTAKRLALNEYRSQAPPNTPDRQSPAFQRSLQGQARSPDLEEFWVTTGSATGK